MLPRPMKVCMLIGVLVLLLASTGWPQSVIKLKTGKKKTAVKTEEHLSLPKPLAAEDVEHIIAGLSDEQVRRLLIDDLKEQARQEDQKAAGRSQASGIAGFIEKTKNLTTLLHTRFEYLHSDNT